MIFSLCLQIGILSERVEQLQNMLTQESFKLDRINGELENANSQLNESHENEEHLGSVIDGLKGELSRRQATFLGSPMVEENRIIAKVTDAAYAAAPGMGTFPSSNFEPINDVGRIEHSFYTDSLIFANHKMV